MSLETIQVKGELLFVLESKQDWINRVPRIMPPKERGKFEAWLWLDVNGNVFEIGLDFSVAERAHTYPCKVYRLQNVASAHPETEGA